jgi:hypothetical protein
MLRIPSLLRLAALVGTAALLAGCETTGSQPTAGLFSPMTHRRASAECWMETEKTAQSMNLDKRVDVVNGCIEKKMRGDPRA